MKLAILKTCGDLRTMRLTRSLAGRFRLVEDDAGGGIKESALSITRGCIAYNSLMCEANLDPQIQFLPSTASSTRTSRRGRRSAARRRV